jgi:uncharacterized protein
MTITAESFRDETPGEPPVRGFLHRAAKPGGDGLVLTHGAGGNCNAQVLIGLAQAFAAAGVNVLRCDLPFRQKRPHGPPSPASAPQDQAGLRRAVMIMQPLFGGRMFLGGQSYGGRQASMLAAAEASLVQALLLLSYPLHPPGRPTQMRTAHLPSLRTPTLFIHGTQDPFGSIEEMEAALRLVTASSRLVPIEGAGHSLTAGRGKDAPVDTVVEAFLRFVAGIPA